MEISRKNGVQLMENSNTVVRYENSNYGHAHSFLFAVRLNLKSLSRWLPTETLACSFEIKSVSFVLTFEMLCFCHSLFII